MKKILLIISILVLSVLSAKADDPYNKFTYQGVLTNSDGTVVSDGSYDFVFKVYDVSTGGSALNTFTKTSISVSKGLFQVELGETGEFEGLDFITTPYYIEITVGATVLSPRIEINPVGKSIISRNLKNGAVTNADISGSNIQNTPIGTTTPSTGKFTSLESGTLKITGGTLAADKVLSSDASGNATWTNALNSISIGATTASTGAFTTLSAGTGKFAVDANGNITKINNVTTSFPASQGAADTYLKNNGSGTLTWAAASGGGGSTEVFALKTADESVTSNTTLQDDDHLSLSWGANTGVYRIKLFFKYTLPGENVDKPIKFKLETQGAGTPGYAYGWLDGGWEASYNLTSEMYTFQYGTPGIFSATFVIDATTNVTGVKFRWAQKNTSPIANTIHKGSWMSYEKIVTP